MDVAELSRDARGVGWPDPRGAVLAAACGRGAPFLRETLGDRFARGGPVAPRSPDGDVAALVRGACADQARGGHVSAAARLTEAIARTARPGAERERAVAVGMLAVSLWHGPEPVAVAIERVEELLAVHAPALPDLAAALDGPLAVLWAMRGRPEESRARLRALRDAGEGPRGRDGVHPAAEVFSAWAELETGADPGEGAGSDAQSAAREELSSRAGERGSLWGAGPGGLADVRARAGARLLLDAGSPERAALRLAPWSGGVGPGLPGRGAVEAAGPFPLSAVPLSVFVDVQGLRARIAAARGRTTRALALADRAVRAASGADSPGWEAVALLDRCDVERRCGMPADARRSAALAGRCFARKGHLPGASRAVTLHANVTPAGGG
ncbi:hypothetical protein [Streptomyces doudnae]|uniref:LuxR family transcriptional regulator n=2 Tax=Streptomyces TaxID=1883 RepID=A0ABD5EG76_9ACTN|nr:hypothetical protein [Streptomyces sp. DSM 41981]MDT0433600.1 hypothetical protein [Streptomyces sp. DSM 41981]